MSGRTLHRPFSLLSLVLASLFVPNAGSVADGERTAEETFDVEIDVTRAR